MKNLANILKQQGYLRFPVIGEGGYAGEQEVGLKVLTAGFGMKAGESYVTKERAKSIQIPDMAEIHHCQYNREFGWSGSVGVWNTDTNQDELNASGLNFS
jgi:hypothetical protein